MPRDSRWRAARSFRAKDLAELRKLLDQEGDAEVQLMLDGQLAWLKRGATEVSMRLVEGEFPDYRGVIPKRIQVSRRGRPRRAAECDQARRDFFQRALSRRQAGARKRCADRVVDQSRDGRSERDYRRRFHRRRVLDRLQRGVSIAGAWA